MSSAPDMRRDADAAAKRHFQALVTDLGSRPPVRKVVLLDRAGRVIARHGVDDRTELSQLATLSAGLHATSARISEMAGDPGRSILRMETDRGVLFLIPLPLPSTYLLLIVLEPEGRGLPEGAPALLDEIAWVDSPGWSVTDPLAFEDSLNRSLDLTADESENPSSGDGSRPEPDPTNDERP